MAAINGYIENYKDCISLLLDALRSVIKKSPSEENKITTLKRRLKTVTSKRDKCMERYIEEDNKLMREDLFNRYQQFVKEIEDIEQQLNAFSNEAKEKEIDFIEKRMKEIEVVVAELQNLQELDRDTVESFIKRIEIAKDGNINVLLYGTGIKNFKVTSWNERQANKKPVSSFVYKGIEYRFNQEQYMGLIKENKYLSYIPLFSFVFPMSNNEISLNSNLPYMKNLVRDIFVDVYMWM